MPTPVIVGDGVADDTAALNSYIAANRHAQLPPGRFRLTGELIPQCDQKLEFAGNSSVLIPDPGYAGKIFNLTGVKNTSISDVRIEAPLVAGATGIYMDGCENVEISKIRFQGGADAPIFAKNSKDCEFDRINIAGGYISAGIRADDCSRIKIKGHKIFAANQGMWGILTVRGSDIKITDGYVEKTPDEFFGIHTFSTKVAVISGNTVENTRREAIAVGGDCYGVRILDNTCQWTENPGIGDFGISLSGYNWGAIVADFLVEGNTVVNSAHDGIAVAGFAQRGQISNNVIRDSAWANAEGFWAGIKLYGWITDAPTEGIFVNDNSVSRIESPGLLYSVFEKPESGSVSRNTVARTKPWGLTTNHVFLSSSTSVSLP